MRPTPWLTAELYRLRREGSRHHSEYGDDFGMFQVRQDSGPLLLVLVSRGMGWEHVSVSTEKRVPTWPEMCLIKEMFWDDEEEVVQFHPRKSEYVNCHPYCLHLWRPLEAELPRPQTILVGPLGPKAAGLRVKRKGDGAATPA